MNQYKLEYRDIGISISDLRKDPDKIREWHCQIVLTIPINGQIEDKIYYSPSLRLYVIQIGET